MSSEGETTHYQLSSQAAMQTERALTKDGGDTCMHERATWRTSAGMVQHTAGREAQRRTGVRPPQLKKSTKDSVAGRLVVRELCGLCVLGDGGEGLVSETGGGGGCEAAIR